MMLEAAAGQTVTLKGRVIRPPSEDGPYTICPMLTYANRTKEAGKRAGISDPEAFDLRRWIQPDGRELDSDTVDFSLNLSIYSYSVHLSLSIYLSMIL